MNWYEFDIETKDGQSRVIKPAHLPDIPEDGFVHLFIDGRKAWEGNGQQFTIELDGILVQLATMAEDQTVSIRYTA